MPSDIIFYRTGREFVAWRRLDEGSANDAAATKDKNAGREAQPGSWVILEKSNTDEPKPDEPDFDRIYVLGYDKSRQEHYTAYRSPDLNGRLPLRISATGDDKFFTVQAEEAGQTKELKYKVYKGDRGILRVEPQGEAARGGRKK